MGVTFEAPTVNSEANSTFENLLDSYKSETYDIQVSYPQFIEDAEDENVPNAVQVFKWSMNGDSEHMGYYYVALTAYGTKDQETLPAAWYVCPRCAANLC